MSYANTAYAAHNFVPTADAFACPPDFDVNQRERDCSVVVRQLAADVEIAESSGDPPTIEMVTARYAEGTALFAAFEVARENMTTAEQAHAKSAARVMRAWSARAAGTLNDKDALKIEHEAIAASAEERARRAALPAARAACRVPSDRLLKLMTDENGRARKEALEDTKKIVDALLSSSSDVGEDVAYARGLGKKSSPRTANWWPLAEFVQRRDEFEPAVEERRAFAKEHGRSLAKDLQPSDLAACFAARRQGFDDARNEAMAKAEHLMQQFAGS